MSSILSRLRSDSRTSVAAAAAFALVFLVAYTIARHAFHSPTMLAVSQILYAVAPACAAVGCAVAAWMAPPGAIRARTVWRLFAFDGLLLFLTEVSYSVTMLWPSTKVGATVVGDSAAAGAVLITFAALFKIAGVGRLGWRTIALEIVDAVSVGSLTFVILFRYWMLPIAASAGSGAVLAAVRPTLYAVVGVVLLIADCVAGAHTGVSRRRPWTAFMGLSVALYSGALILWPVWSLAAQGVRPNPVAQALIALALLSGYWLLFLAAVARVAYRSRPWVAESTVDQQERRALPEMIVTSVALTSVVALGAAALHAPNESPEQIVYTVALAVASTTLVLRTLLQSAETSSLIDRATTDAATGARNLRSMRDWFSRCAGVYRRTGRPFGVIVLDLDGFGAVNDAVGWEQGDRVLGYVAAALSSATGQPVFRLSSDEFVLIVPAEGDDAIEATARVAANAVTHVSGPGGHLTASVGWSSCPADGTELDGLLAKADRARAWARRHGVGNVVHYDVRIAHPSMAGEWQRLATEQARVDVARALAAAADARDPANFTHSRNVAALAVLLAEEIELDSEETKRIEMAALLHDVGKIALPDNVVESSAAGRRVQARLRDHPALGEQLTQSLGVPGLAQWIRSHHEAWDGSGYPDGLAGEDIPLASRIIALADAYDTMTASGEGERALSKGAALQEIDLGMGSRFDPFLAERFIIAVAATEALGWSDQWPAA